MGIKKKRIRRALYKAQRAASANPTLEAENSVALEELKQPEKIIPSVETPPVEEKDESVEKPTLAESGKKKAVAKKVKPKITSRRKKSNSSK